MADETDPLKERLEHARRELNEKIRRGEALDGDDLVGVRDDLNFVYGHFRNQIIKLDRIKVTKNPNVVKAFWILLPTGAGTLIAYIGYVVGQAGGGP